MSLTPSNAKHFPWESIKGKAFFVAQLGLEPRFKV